MTHDIVQGILLALAGIVLMLVAFTILWMLGRHASRWRAAADLLYRAGIIALLMLIAFRLHRLIDFHGRLAVRVQEPLVVRLEQSADVNVIALPEKQPLHVKVIELPRMRRALEDEMPRRGRSPRAGDPVP